jgi:hypothetical protein
MSTNEQYTQSLDDLTLECWDKLCAAESYEESMEILAEFKAVFETIKIVNPKN